jgi:putative endonuclease
MVYMLRCADDTVYTGITNNLDRRMVMHYEGKGAKYTRGRGPFEILFSEQHDSRSAALKREAALKKLSRSDKILMRNR